MKTHLKTIIILLVIIVAVSLLFYTASRKKPVLISIGVVETDTVEAVVTNTRAGTVKACRRANLSPAIGGQIAKLYVKEGDRVEKGQILLELWNEDLLANIKLAKSQLKTARATADQACILAEAAQREARRVVELEKKKLAAVEDVDRTVTNAKAVQAGCRAARAAVEVSVARIAVVKAGLERTQLIAPFSGRVAEVTGELGEFVTPSPPGIPTPPAIDLIDASCLYISAPIDEVDAPAIKAGMKARITLDAFSGKSFKGEVQRVAPYVLEKEKQARVVDMETYFIDPEEYLGLLPGYSADVEVILNVRENVLRIPTEAILDNKRVFVYHASDEVLEERQIKIGLSNWKFTEIISGLDQGEQIVLSVDRKGVSDGAFVEPESAASSE